MFKLRKTPPLVDLARMAWRRFDEQRCLQIASSLTFTALLAIVPIITVGLTLISAFPVFREFMLHIQQFLVSNMLPESAESIAAYAEQFADNAAKLTAVGILFLFVTAMIMLIVAAAFYLNFVIGILGIPQALARFVGEIGASPIHMMWFLFLFYLLLGCFLETLSMMVGTIPVIFPLVLALGIDPVWFGIFLVLMCEIALITPPVGMNLYVVQGIRREGSIADVIYGTLPFLLMMFVLTALLIYFPDLALWLPRVTFG